MRNLFYGLAALSLLLLAGCAGPAPKSAAQQARAAEAKYGPDHVLMDTDQDCWRDKPARHPEKLMTYQQWVSGK